VAPDVVAEVFDRRLRRRLTAIAWALVAATVVAVAVLWPTGRATADLTELGVSDVSYPATVTAVQHFECPGEGVDEAVASGEPGVCVEVSFRLGDGPDAGEVRTVSLFDVGDLPAYEVGDELVVPFLENATEQYRYSPMFDRERGAALWFLAAVFAVLVVAQGRLRGVAALAGLAGSVAVLAVFTVPALLGGASPVAVAVVSAAVISFFALYFTHGFSSLTTVALLGALGSLGLVAVLAAVFTSLASLSGLSAETQFLRAMGGGLDFGGLLLAGIIIGTLGALDDMTVTQASAVTELRAANPAMGFVELYRSAMRIGRAHVGSAVNTLALAYAGAALPLLLWFMSSQQTFGRVLSSEVVATEIVRTLVGSIGLVVSVPLTTAVAARLVTPRRAVAATPACDDTHPSSPPDVDHQD
jgi:uncharacterized membrane protein